MNIRHLKIFIMVAECENMSVAAKKLFISQPSVSQAIKEIEDYYGVKLFERLSKKLYITDSGNVLLKYARHIVQSFEEMEINLKNSGESICLSIGATITVGTGILEPIISKFENIQKEFSTKIVVNNTNIIEQMLLQSKLDIAIVEGKVTNPDLIKLPIYKDKLVAVVGKTHPFYNKEYISVEELSGKDLISREEGSGARDIFEQILLEKNISMKIKWCCTNTEAIKSATIGGQGLAILSTLMIEKELKNGILRIIPIQEIDISRDICVVFHKDKFISDNIKLFIKFLQDYKY